MQFVDFVGGFLKTAECELMCIYNGDTGDRYYGLRRLDGFYEILGTV